MAFDGFSLVTKPFFNPCLGFPTNPLICEEKGLMMMIGRKKYAGKICDFVFENYCFISLVFTVFFGTGCTANASETREQVETVLPSLDLITVFIVSHNIFIAFFIGILN